MLAPVRTTGISVTATHRHIVVLGSGVAVGPRDEVSGHEAASFLTRETYRSAFSSPCSREKRLVKSKKMARSKGLN